MVQWVKGSSVAIAAAWVTAVVQVHSLTQELLHAAGMALKKKKKKIWSFRCGSAVNEPD